MISLFKNVYINKLDLIVTEYKNIYHRTTDEKPADVKSSTCIDFGVEKSNRDSKFEVDNHARVSKYKTISAKGYTRNWSEEVFEIKKNKSAVPWMYVIEDVNDKKLMESFRKKNYKKSNQIEFKIEKVIKKKGDK